MKMSYFKVLSMVAAVAVMAGCSGSKKQAVVETAPAKIIVKTAPSSEEMVEQVAEFTGNIEPFQKNNISASMPVRIDKLLVDVGARVSKGELLAVMDKTQFNQSAVQQANLQADYDRMKSVFDAGGISKQQLDQTETQLKVTKEATRNLKENIELRSPVSGVVTARNFDAGDMVNASGAILTVMQINPLKVMIDVSEQYFRGVKMGMPVDINVDLFPDKEFKGKVSLIHPSINTDTRTFTVEVTIPNGDNTLRPGMFSRTVLNLGKQSGILVNDLAVQKQIGSNEKFLYVVKDGKAERRVVKTGRTIGTKTHILSGVAAGEEVVVSGISKLAEGKEVEVKNN